ncbi:hypothetical protein PPYR_03697 [Photinus pyralis]|uniref:Lipocalin/cytosolic fatty-acid binding domain-containing protein n=2 Tax=Photinus pyralis TaxID=7054 RepID=A0A5N4A3K8_PHOPY|nr:uncharacterized protein LOC116161492 [Photinus pyralis]KAB0791897.1 hypothetical protein PPYR_03697 [Photinus pyralis]
MQKLLITIFVTISAATGLPPPVTEGAVCPHERSMEGLDMRQMVGEWFVYETATVNEEGGSSKPVSCQSFIIDNSSDTVYVLKSVWGDSRFKFIFNYNIIEEDRPINPVSKTSLGTDKIDGDETIFLNQAVDEIRMSVLATDYRNVAVIFTCEQEETYTRKVYLLRRIRDPKAMKRMEKILIGNVYSKLHEYGFDLENLQEVEQEGC